ncbi:hypothetical protein D9M68_689960 [compost metagenome]
MAFRRRQVGHAVVKNARQQRRANRRPLVVHRDPGLLRIGRQRQGDGRARCAAALGVAQEVRDHVFQREAIGPHLQARQRGVVGVQIAHAVDAGEVRVVRDLPQEGVDVQPLAGHVGGDDRLAR